ncbi:MAG: addiction module protein [Verrucomicrobiota bacterium]
MSITATQICEQFELLSDEERIQVFHTLLDIMGPVSGDDSEIDWEVAQVAEAERRDAELTSGKVQALSAEEFWQSIEESKLARRSA